MLVGLPINFDRSLKRNERSRILLAACDGGKSFLGEESDDGEGSKMGEGVGRLMRSKCKVMMEDSVVVLGLFGNNEIVLQHHLTLL